MPGHAEDTELRLTLQDGIETNIARQRPPPERKTLRSNVHWKVEFESVHYFPRVMSYYGISHNHKDGSTIRKALYKCGVVYEDRCLTLCALIEVVPWYESIFRATTGMKDGRNWQIISNALKKGAAQNALTNSPYPNFPNYTPRGWVDIDPETRIIRIQKIAKEMMKQFSLSQEVQEAIPIEELWKAVGATCAPAARLKALDSLPLQSAQHNTRLEAMWGAVHLLSSIQKTNPKMVVVAVYSTTMAKAPRNTARKSTGGKAPRNQACFWSNWRLSHTPPSPPPPPPLPHRLRYLVVLPGATNNVRPSFCLATQELLADVPRLTHHEISILKGQFTCKGNNLRLKRGFFEDNERAFLDQNVLRYKDSVEGGYAADFCDEVWEVFCHSWPHSWTVRFGAVGPITRYFQVLLKLEAVCDVAVRNERGLQGYKDTSLTLSNFRWLSTHIRGIPREAALACGALANPFVFVTVETQIRQRTHQQIEFGPNNTLFCLEYYGAEILPAERKHWWAGLGGSGIIYEKDWLMLCDLILAQPLYKSILCAALGLKKEGRNWKIPCNTMTQHTIIV
ncbi:hypothetical protein CYLTODRAFT_415644 [Cylindrobasidium torrendii FP15055 ss-10]|uniref:Uncharacterized protein n=1 Tax=Cylindrobasidium torrendii FP15055 ss-10 TaxID=1314674 RepID=A0A0D7ASC7_9AGAR|nr:hypothetical protein CYLTODRAFT_415644 [Cylindrobasidium torrendii FP15055 ss-10]